MNPRGSHEEQPLHEYLRQHAREQPDKPACIWYGRAITFAELDRASDAFAARLQELGIRKGDPVALFMNNCPQYLMAQYGIQKIGAIASPCGALNKEHELTYQLDDLGARVIVAAEPLLPIVRNVRGSTALEHVFVVRYADLLPDQPEIAVPDELLAMKAEGKSPIADAEDFLAVAASGVAAEAIDAEAARALHVDDARLAVGVLAADVHRVAELALAVLAEGARLAVGELAALAGRVAVAARALLVERARLAVGEPAAHAARQAVIVATVDVLLAGVVGVAAPVPGGRIGRRIGRRVGPVRTAVGRPQQVAAREQEAEDPEPTPPQCATHAARVVAGLAPSE